jgi:hypothetical protein
VVIDELHMVSDPHRGAGLEMALTKLLFSPHAAGIQIIGMSATSESIGGRRVGVGLAAGALACLNSLSWMCAWTWKIAIVAGVKPLSPRPARVMSPCFAMLCRAVGGLEALGSWLRARLFLTNFRPVPLAEHAVFGGTVYAKHGDRRLAQQVQHGDAVAGVAGNGESGEVDECLVAERKLSNVGGDPLIPLLAEVNCDRACSTRGMVDAQSNTLSSGLGKTVFQWVRTELMGPWCRWWAKVTQRWCSVARARHVSAVLH